MQQPLPAPPAPAPKKNTVKIVGIIAAVVVLLSIIGSSKEASTSSTTDYTSTSTVDDAVTAEMVVDAMTASDKSGFCSAYYTLNDYDLALQFFSRNYDVVTPSAQDVFDELLSRC
jgi:hypothetical protein